MKTYVKPSVNVIELQLRENIAAVPTTVYKGTASATARASQAYNLALGANQGIAGNDYNSASIA